MADESDASKPEATSPQLAESAHPVLKLSTDVNGFDLAPSKGSATLTKITIDTKAPVEQQYGAIGRIAALGLAPLAPQGRPKHHVLRTPGNLVHKTPKAMTSPRITSQDEAKVAPKTP
jgi:hypothetical protein